MMGPVTSVEIVMSPLIDIFFGNCRNFLSSEQNRAARIVEFR